jgi:deoxyribodipyrimidine photo-lyase
MTTLVWFKRDLRMHDHAPLAAAAQAGPAVGLYVIEPGWLASPECDARHVAFVLGGLALLRARLAAKGLPLLVEHGPMTEVLERLRQRLGVVRLFSHEETGPGWTYDRDRAVATWCRAQGVMWQEWPQTGVVRRLRSRTGWAARWAARMNAAECAEPRGFTAPRLDLPELPTLAHLGLAPTCVPLPESGEDAALATLDDFLLRRGGHYRRELSSPLGAATGCSRLSAHLAFGMVSMRRVHQATEARIAALQAEGDDASRRFAHALRGFAGRLRWHCHFMQKLEDEPEIEWRNFSRACDGLREPAFDRMRFDAWCQGQTGYPMVDACMRSLVATGWLNFRMRAMLVSFAAYHLWLHWREPGLHLARQFLDFEAGIHWSQMQMQSGTTGINTLRIYSPTKQARDHDPQGVFIRRWVPELARLPLPFLAEPWTAPPEVQRAAACVIDRDYPAPIVDATQAVAQAKDRLYGLRRQPEARAEADAIQSRHGSRKSGLPPTTKRARTRRAPSPGDLQRDLFADEATS